MFKTYSSQQQTKRAIVWDGRNETYITIAAAMAANDRGIPRIELEDTLVIDTLGGALRAKVGDYVIESVRGEYYPCDPVLFESVYYEVGSEEEPS